MFVDKNFLKRTLKQRNPGSHKGENGKVLVVGGSKLYFGSPALVGLSALRAGADLVYLLVPESIAATVASYSPDLIVYGYEGDYLNESAMYLFYQIQEKTDAMVIGNGITKNSSVLKVAAKMIKEYKKPCVVDADAIVDGGYKVKDAVYTPHVKEFTLLADLSVPQQMSAAEKVVKTAAENIGSVVLLKNPVDIISDGNRTAFNKTGNAGMTVGGTGDTLAGILGTLLAQGCPAFEAAGCAAHINGAAGDLAYKKFGNSLLASDLISEIPNVLKKQ
ncbi:ADP-dependent (S)-NAD(P)H-hydrate dehydratase [uncultured archaeon]|nr:ADP-dependent (S)-NAD(P)H-hydrate dehydratase [uncultured archaeon]